MFAHPVIFPDDGVQVHVNNVPVTWEVRVRLGEVLVQMVSYKGILDRSGVG